MLLIENYPSARSVEHNEHAEQWNMTLEDTRMIDEQRKKGGR